MSVVTQVLVVVLMLGFVLGSHEGGLTKTNKNPYLRVCVLLKYF